MRPKIINYSAISSNKRFLVVGCINKYYHYRTSAEDLGKFIPNARYPFVFNGMFQTYHNKGQSTVYAYLLFNDRLMR